MDSLSTQPMDLSVNGPESRQRGETGKSKHGVGREKYGRELCARQLFCVRKYRLLTIPLPLHYPLPLPFLLSPYYSFPANQILYYGSVSLWYKYFRDTARSTSLLLRAFCVLSV